MTKIPLPSDPPRIHEHHVRLPDQAADILEASHAHVRGYTGKGIRVAVIDSGFFPHPYYLQRGYRIRYIPTRKEPWPHRDQYGHGTAQLASLFCIAPGVEALVIKCMDRDPSSALEKAISLRPHVISCAWGFNIDKPGTAVIPDDYLNIERLILQAVEMGITVVAAAGNGQYSFPGSMPEVIAAGGVYYSPQGRFEASDVASQYESSIFPGRQIPDVCGLVGNRPHGRLLLVPVPPKARLALRPGFNTIAAGEAVRLDSPGWAMFSGTSAATAMVSGAAACLLQAKPGLTPPEIRDALVYSGRIESESGSRVLSVNSAIEYLLNPLVSSPEVLR